MQASSPLPWHSSRACALLAARLSSLTSRAGAPHAHRGSNTSPAVAHMTSSSLRYPLDWMQQPLLVT
jgi:hypothetical protein